MVSSFSWNFLILLFEILYCYIAAPEIAVVSVAPFRFATRQPVNLRCSTTDSNGIISWLNACVMITIPEWSVIDCIVSF